MRRLAALLLCCAGLPARAHVLDQYLQIAQIALDPGGAHLELRLVPGAQVSARILSLLDTDGDGQISREEEQAYVSRVLRDLALKVDSRLLPVALEEAQFPSPSEMKAGTGVIRLQLAVQVPLDAAGAHELTFRNDHLPELGVYLANVLVPQTSAIQITGQRRDPLQRSFQIEFQVPEESDARPWLP